MFGFERSGTTLLSMMVGAHPEIAVPLSVTGLVIVFILTVTAIAAPLVSPHDPAAQQDVHCIGMTADIVGGFEQAHLVLAGEQPCRAQPGNAATDDRDFHEVSYPSPSFGCRSVPRSRRNSRATRDLSMSRGRIRGIPDSGSP